MLFTLNVGVGFGRKNSKSLRLNEEMDGRSLIRLSRLFHKKELRKRSVRKFSELGYSHEDIVVKDH